MILTFGNTFDLTDKIWSGGYTETIKIDERHNVSLLFTGQKEKIISTDSKGKRIIEQVYNYEEYSLEFLCNVNTCRQLANLKKLDTFTIQTDIETITPEEKEIDISDYNGNNEQNRKVNITYRINFTNKKTGNTNNEITVNTVPVAQNPLITGTPVIGQTLTATYTYFDADGDAEGATTFQWWRSEDVNKSVNVQVISGETSQTYLQTSSDYNHFLWCQITPVAATGASPGLTVETPSFQSQVDNIPAVTGVTINPASFPIVRGVGTADAQYTYSDANGDLEGTSLFDWQFAEDNAGTNSYSFGSGDPVNIPAFPVDVDHIRVGVTPVAQTGASPGNKVFSAWLDITGA